MEEDQQQQQQQQSSPLGSRATRRGSTATTTSVSSNLSSVVENSRDVEEQDSRRRQQIKEIMKSPDLSPKEKSLAVQSLMDGRRRGSMASRRSSIGSACDYSDADGDALMGEASNNNHAYALHYGYGTYRHQDEQSIDSSVSSCSNDDDNNDNNADQDHDQKVAAATASLSSSPPQRQPPLLQPPPGASYRQFHGRSHSLQDWNDTDRIHAAPNFTVLSQEATARFMEQSRPVCQHYERKCTFISPCCGLAFGCRICHDDCPSLPPPVVAAPAAAAASAAVATGNNHTMSGAASAVAESKAPPPPHHLNKMERRRSMPVDLGDMHDEETHHLIDRFAVKEVICRECYTRQSSKTNNCIKCGIQFGEYHCNICNLWMSSKESPYHCADCGFCRVGGRENFRHCDDCGMCIDSLLFDEHNCKSGKYMSDCPICQEDLFSSRMASHEMPCGHAIHWHCFQELTSYDTRCPVCKKTAESPEQMAATWSAIAMGIALQPVPRDMARVVNIVCNDCESAGANRRWHFLGVRCMECLSFNTSVEQIVMHGADAADYLDEIEAAQAREANGVPANISVVGPSSTNNTNNNIDTNNADAGATNDDEDMDDPMV